MIQTPCRGRALARRLARTTATLAALGGAAVSLRWSVGYPVPLARSLATGSPTFDQLLSGSAALLAWAVLGWASVVVTLELATALPGMIGRQFARLARIVTPAAVRRFAQAAIGFSVLLGPMTAGRAMAADSGGPSPATSTAILAAPSPTSQPRAPLDRPVAQGLVAIDLDRPAQPALPGPGASLGSTTTPTPPGSPTALAPTATPTPPPPPATARALSPSPAALVAGVPQREATSPTYVVRRGDALWDVAARHLGPRATATDIAREWPRWYAANRSVIGADPNLIHPGDVLVPPSL